MKLLYLFFLLFLFLQLSCKDNSTNPPSNNNPPGYQEDIPWPSLADSPWPMYRGDPQNTGRSRYSGPALGNLEWSIDTIYNRSGVATGPDSVIYLISMQEPAGLFALTKDRKTKWRYRFPGSLIFNPCSPIITSEGVVYTSSPEAKLYAVKPDGSLKWELNNVHIQTTGNCIGKDGTLYLFDAGGNGKLIGVNSNGTLLWSYQINSSYGDFSSLALSPDSKTLYIIAHLQKNFSLIAFDLASQTIKWETKENIIGNPVVSFEGDIFVTSSTDSGFILLYRIDPDGNELWNYPVYEPEITSNMALDKSGNIYTGFKNLYSINYKGELNWIVEMPGDQYITAPIVIDKNNNVFVTCNNLDGYSLFCLDYKSNILWSQEIPGDRSGYSAAINYNSLIIPSFHSNYIWGVR